MMHKTLCGPLTYRLRYGCKHDTPEEIAETRGGKYRELLGKLQPGFNEDDFGGEGVFGPELEIEDGLDSDSDNEASEEEEFEE